MIKYIITKSLCCLSLAFSILLRNAIKKKPTIKKLNTTSKIPKITNQITESCKPKAMQIHPIIKGAMSQRGGT